MRLQIKNVTKADLGKYTCKAKNSLGETSGEITLYGESLVHLTCYIYQILSYGYYLALHVSVMAIMLSFDIT